MKTYSRSKKVEYHPEEAKIFLRLVKSSLEKEGYYLHINNYPYDQEQEQKVRWKIKQVKTLHITLWHKEDLDSIDEVIETIKLAGFYPQRNDRNKKSIPEIEHIHFIKVLEYLD